jgi:phosphoribosyl 1,2-cyclic phosphodiesterase
MADRFTVLASGSTGNAALLEVNGFGLLIDCGLHPKTLYSRLREVNTDWGTINAVILTHTHGDHWKDFTLADLRSRRIPLYAHPMQLDQLSQQAPSYEPLRTASLTRPYHENQTLELAPGFRVRPVRVSHDSDPTFGFRFDHVDPKGIVWSVGYASDLGCASEELIHRFAGVDVLALEYNHDEQLERMSRRPRMLIDRVLGDSGHLSNHQAAQVTTAIASRSGAGFPSHVVQLHLSRECNRPELANAAGRNSLAGLNPLSEVITARQNVAAKSISLSRNPNAANRTAARNPTAPCPVPAPRVRFQPSLPGFEN